MDGIPNTTCNIASPPNIDTARQTQVITPMITYTDSIDNITADHLHGFFVGWPKRPSPETHLRILRAAHRIVLAVDSGTGNVVGFINAIGDGILSAYIPLLEVLPQYQGRGIGSELVRRMLTALGSLYMIDLTCDPGLQPFYERLGLRRATGMMHRNYNRQAGS
jgi:ribosomal protein S18 acetylase RimI-like enzyme